MADCDKKLAKSFARECLHRPKEGVLDKWFANWDDIDFSGVTMTNNGMLVTSLTLKAGAKLYKAGGNDKTSGIKHAFVQGDYVNGYTHTDTFTVLYNGVDQREQAQNIADGARVVTISKKVDGGLNGEIRYEIAGLESGMLMVSDDYDSNANSGTRTFSVATKEKEEERTGIKIFNDTDEATTAAWITANEYAAA